MREKKQTESKKAEPDPDEGALARRRRGEALSLGYNLLAGMLVFSGIGWWIDKKRGTAPFWTVVGMFMGLVYGGYEVWKLARMYRDGEGDS
jgi:F0F1-type ATP synthase assembly protein I